MKKSGDPLVKWVKRRGRLVHEGPSAYPKRDGTFLFRPSSNNHSCTYCGGVIPRGCLAEVSLRVSHDEKRRLCVNATRTICCREKCVRNGTMALMTSALDCPEKGPCAVIHMTECLT